MTKLLTMSMALLLAAGAVTAAEMPTGKTHANSLGMKLARIEHRRCLGSKTPPSPLDPGA